MLFLVVRSSRSTKYTYLAGISKWFCDHNSSARGGWERRREKRNKLCNVVVLELGIQLCPNKGKVGTYMV